MRQIELTKNKHAIVDDEDFETLSKYNWYCSNQGYAVRTPWPSNGIHQVLMHRVITDCPKGKQVDHINGDRLDNRRSNLRIVTHLFNRWNSSANSRNTSGQRGVDWRKDKKKWRARINVAGKSHSLGHFVNIEDAVKAYEEAANKHYGEFKRK